MEKNAPIENYRNGPLPSHLKKRAYFTSDKAEFALRKDKALAYLNWCQTVGLAVLGYESRQFPAPQFKLVEERKAMPKDVAKSFRKLMWRQNENASD